MSGAPVRIPVTRLEHAAGLPLPDYASDLSAGMDLAAAVDAPLAIEAGGRALVPTGLRLALPPGYEAQVRPRSGLALDHGVTVLNAPGTIDADYRGEIGVILINLGQEPFTIQRGDRIAQLVITKQIEVAVVTTAEAQQMARGEGAIAREGPVPLRVLAFLREPYVLVCHSEFDRERAYLMTFGLFDEEGSSTLDRTAGSLSSAMRRASEIQVPLHVGAREFYLELGKGAQDS
ncbi:MAG: dUTP diphosphatase [SAR324 cluster bacterium]|nr:dUTP diphosphatase [SAR324 cluster bacterium]